MSQILALEWNDHEARAAVGTRHGHRVVIEQAFDIPLPPEPREEGSTGLDVGQSIAAALAERGVGQIDALVAVGRGSVELRQLQLPAAPDDELPGMVRLRAMLEFNELDEKWLLDFVPIDGAEKGNRNVLAAAIAPAVIERIEAVGQRSGLRLQHVLLRSCAAAALLARASTPPSPRSAAVRKGGVQLLVELFSGHADLTAIVDGRVLLPRMVRLRGEIAQPQAMQGLLTEIRLTLGAVQNQCGRSVMGIVLCGRGETDGAIARQIEEAAKIRTTLLDPFAGLELDPRLRDSLPLRPGRFAAVLGMLLAQREQTSQAIDFLHPRQTVVAASPRRKWTLVAAAAAALLVAYLVYGRLAYGRLDDEVRRLEARAAVADALLRAGGSRNIATANEIGSWADGEVVWLDRFRELSDDFPAANVATIGHLVLNTQSERSTGMRPMLRSSAVTNTVGTMHLEGRARDSKAVSAMEQSLGAHARRLEFDKSNEDRSMPPYAMTFSATVHVGRGSKP